MPSEHRMDLQKRVITYPIRKSVRECGTLPGTIKAEHDITIFSIQLNEVPLARLANFLLGLFDIYRAHIPSASPLPQVDEIPSRIVIPTRLSSTRSPERSRGQEVCKYINRICKFVTYLRTPSSRKVLQMLHKGLRLPQYSITRVRPAYT